MNPLAPPAAHRTHGDARGHARAARAQPPGAKVSTKAGADTEKASGRGARTARGNSDNLSHLCHLSHLEPSKPSKPNGFMIRRSRSLHAQDHTDKNGCEQTRGDFRGSLHVTSHASPRILARLHRSMAQAMRGRATRTLPCARRPPTSTIMQRRGAHLYSGAPRNRTQTRILRHMRREGRTFI